VIDIICLCVHADRRKTARDKGKRKLNKVQKTDIITAWEKRRRCWTNIGSPDIVRG